MAPPVRAQSRDPRLSAQEPPRRPPLDVRHLTGEEGQPVLAGEHRRHRIFAALPRKAERGADPERAGHRALHRKVLDFPSGARRLRGGGDGSDFGYGHPAEALLPLPARRPLHHHDVVPHIGQAERIVPQTRHREGRHLRLGEGAAHAVGVHHRETGPRRRQKALQGVGASDLERHHGREGPPHPLREHPDRTRGEVRIRKPFLADQRSAHGGNHRHQVVVRQRFRGDQAGAESARGLGAQVQERVVGIPAAPRSENPGAGGEILHLKRPEAPFAGEHAIREASSPRTKQDGSLIGDDIPAERFALRCESVGIRPEMPPDSRLVSRAPRRSGARPALSTGCQAIRIASRSGPVRAPRPFPDHRPVAAAGRRAGNPRVPRNGGGGNPGGRGRRAGRSVRGAKCGPERPGGEKCRSFPGWRTGRKWCWAKGSWRRGWRRSWNGSRTGSRPPSSVPGASPGSPTDRGWRSRAGLRCGAPGSLRHRGDGGDADSGGAPGGRRATAGPEGGAVRGGGWLSLLGNRGGAPRVGGAVPRGGSHRSQLPRLHRSARARSRGRRREAGGPRAPRPRGRRRGAPLPEPRHRRHPTLFEPATLLLGAGLALLGAVVGMELLTRVGITPNSSILGGGARHRGGTRPVGRDPSVPRHRAAEPAADRHLGGNLWWCERGAAAGRDGVALRPAGPRCPPWSSGRCSGGSSTSPCSTGSTAAGLFRRKDSGRPASPRRSASAPATRAGSGRCCSPSEARSELSAGGRHSHRHHRVCWIGNQAALAMFGCGLLARGYAPELFGVDLAAVHAPHGLMIGAGAVALWQMGRSVRSGRAGPANGGSRRDDRAAGEDRTPGLRHRLRRFRGGRRARGGARRAGDRAWAPPACSGSPPSRRRPPSSPNCWWGSPRCTRGGSRPSRPRWSSSCSDACSAFAPSPSCSSRVFASATGPAFADMGYDLKAGWILRGEGRDPAREREGRRAQRAAEVFGLLVASGLVLLTYASLFPRRPLPRRTAGWRWPRSRPEAIRASRANWRCGRFRGRSCSSSAGRTGSRESCFRPVC